MRTLVISDIHNRIVQAQLIIDKVPHDKLVLLGDIFDSWNDTLEQTKCSAEWYKTIINRPNTITLFGNHDVGYCYPANHCFYCSGFAKDKLQIINSIISREDWNKVRPYHIEQNWLLSHAGLSLGKLKQLAPSMSPKNYNLANIEAVLDTEYKGYIERDELTYRYCKLFSVGYDRGGNEKHGGITWCDFSSLVPIRNIKQIVGHSILKFPCLQYYKNNRDGVLDESVYMGEDDKIGFQHLHSNALKPYGKILNADVGSVLGMDTNNRHYVIIENGEAFIYENK